MATERIVIELLLFLTLLLLLLFIIYMQGVFTITYPKQPMFLR
jgi:hypothetical protein